MIRFLQVGWRSGLQSNGGIVHRVSHAFHAACRFVAALSAGRCRPVEPSSEANTDRK